MNAWILLIVSLPTGNATARQRAWRALKGCGAAVLRDGVYLLPERDDLLATFDRIAADVRAGGGAASVLRVEEPAGADFAVRFDRGDRYAALLADIAAARGRLGGGDLVEAGRVARRLRRTLDGIVAIDFFPGPSLRQAESAVSDLEQAAARLASPDEPRAAAGSIQPRAVADYRGRTWATRRRPWVDRLACAWLIRRCIDPAARILWLAAPSDCPPDALGFDFDGATFSHVGNRVSVEVLVASFGLSRPALDRVCLLVHYLDVGGVQPAEAAGVESVLGGLRASIADDDALLAAASGVFDGLLAAWEKQGDSQP